MKNSDRVMIYPHGSPEQKALGVVAMIHRSQCLLLLSLPATPPFALAGLALHPEFGMVMLLVRVLIEGEPWGPWIEAMDGGHYEIEEASEDEIREAEAAAAAPPAPINYIVGGPREVVPRSRAYSCECGVKVWLSPSSQQLVGQGAVPCCRACANRRIEEGANSMLSSGSIKELHHWGSNN